MTHWKKLTNPNYLGSYAFQQGEEKPVTISRITQEEVTNPSQPEIKERCIVAHFQQPEKPLILNKTNCKAIERLAGTPNIEEWAGVGIILCVQKVPAFGDLVEAVRIRPVKPYICADCGGIITGYGGKTHQEIREHTKSTYKRQLCPECAKKAAAQMTAPALVPDQQPATQEPAHRRRRASA